MGIFASTGARPSSEAATRARTRSLRRASLTAALLLLSGGIGIVPAVKAEGSRTTFPSGITGARVSMTTDPGGPLFGNVVSNRLFVYVYAQQGEYILLGSSNRRDGVNTTESNILVYNPQDFGLKGNETRPVNPNFECNIGAIFQPFNSTAPSLPAGWSSVNEQGTNVGWVTSAGAQNYGNNVLMSGPTTAGINTLQSDAYVVSGASPRLSFYMVRTMDGGQDDGLVLEVSINGGAFADALSAGNGTGAFELGGYEAAITSDTNALNGRQAWVNTQNASYLPTIYRLPDSVVSGDSVRFRWRFASNGNTASTIRIDSIAGSNLAGVGANYFGETAAVDDTRGAIRTRAAELAGPNRADNTPADANRWAPCAYRAPVTGVYGVQFTSAPNTGNPSIGLLTADAAGALPAYDDGVAAWEVQVRATDQSLVDINGRVFTYAWVGDVGSNAVPTAEVFKTLFYVTEDGYRFRQTQNGLNPFVYATFANSQGFVDNGNPLYKSVRGDGVYVTNFQPAGSGVTAQAPAYPVFISNVSDSGPNDLEVERVLTALGIPTVPPVPSLNSVSFAGSVSGSTTALGAGGVFTFSTINTLSYQIVISRDGVNFDPALPTNRVINGTAFTGTHNVLWNGRDNAGSLFPVGTNYAYRVEGRNGETHLPLFDTEGMTGGGPTIERLNGSLDDRFTVYYDDRGYVTRNGTAVGQLNGHLCGAGHLQVQTSPVQALGGTNSQVSYRSYPNVTSDPNSDCSNAADVYFGTAKALNTWVYQRTPVTSSTLTIVPAGGTVDVGTQVTVTASALPGETVVGTLRYFNNSSVVANGVLYTARIGTPGSCPTGLTFPVAPAGVTFAYNASTCVVTFTGMPTSLPISGSAGSELLFEFAYVAPSTGPQTIQTTIAATGDLLPGTGASNTANGSTIINSTPLLRLVKSSNAPQPIDVASATSTSYILTLFNDGVAATSGTISIADTLRAGLRLSSFSGTGWSCTGLNTANVACEYSTPIPANSVAAVLNLTVSIDPFTPDANNTARVSGGGDPECLAPPAVLTPAVAARCTSTVTVGTVPVTLSYVSSSVSNAILTVEFMTLAEAGTAGFRVLGSATANAQRARLAPLILAKGSSLAPQSYRIDVPHAGEREIWIEEVASDGLSTVYGPYPVGSERGERVAGDLIDWPAIRSAVSAHESAQWAAIRTGRSGSALEAEVRLSESGPARITHADLVAQGIDWSGQNPARVELLRGGESLPLRYSGPAAIGPGSVFQFLGEAIEGSLYTRTQVYRLRLGDDARVMPTEAVSPVGLSTVDVVRDWMTHAPNREYDLSARSSDPYSAFRLVRSSPATASRTEVFLLNDLHVPPLANQPDEGGPMESDRIQVEIWSDFDVPHSVQFVLNGATLGRLEFRGRGARVFETQVPTGLLQRGANSLRLELLNNGVELDSVNLESIRVSYPRSLVASNDRLAFTLPQDFGSGQTNDRVFADGFGSDGVPACLPISACVVFRATGLSTPDVVVMRQRGDEVTRLASVRVSGASGAHQIEFATSPMGADRYWIAPANGSVPLTVAPALPVSDPLAGGPASYLIISHGSLISGLAPFIAAREVEGFTVRVVDVQDIYRHYGTGAVDPEAIRVAIADAAQRLGTRYVLLVGGDTRDYFNLGGHGSLSFVPTLYRQVGPIITFAPTDVPFADLDQNSTQDLAIGRWPVRSLSELGFVIQKTLRYSQADHANKVLLLSDRDQGSVEFDVQTRLVPMTLGSSWQSSEIALESFPGGVGPARNAMVQAVNAGRALTVYMGHGAPLAWSMDGLVTSQQLTDGLFNNPTRPTIAWAVGCYGTYFTQPAYNSVSHGLLGRNASGAAAVFGASTLTNISGDIVWLNALGPRIRGQRLGDSLRITQNLLVSAGEEYKDIWMGVSLLGDPSLKLNEAP